MTVWIGGPSHCLPCLVESTLIRSLLLPPRTCCCSAWALSCTLQCLVVAVLLSLWTTTSSQLPAAAEAPLTVCSLVNFLQTAQRNISNPSTINNGTKPTELWLPSNCIQELDANFEGTSVSDILLPAANSTQNVDDCCALCRWEHAHALQNYHRRKQPLRRS